ncbi:MAG: UDP-glucose 4-epimerase GalE [Myxococcota bacterium]|nr:UDP-glucose 4-epimerase GalE [Myxococcota bacterium]
MQHPEGRILVVGGAGYIGSHTVRLLQERGVEVVVFDDLSAGHREAVSAPFVEGSLRDREALARLFSDYSPRSVIHFAAQCLVGESMEKPAKYYEENVLYTFNLLEEMRAAGCLEIVFSSTCATYGDPVEVPMPDSHPQVPVNTYGRTKLHIEQMMDDYARAYGLHFAALRYFNAAGAALDSSLGEDHDPETHLIPLVLQVALGKRESISIYGDDYDTPDGTCIRDYIHVDDLADAHLRALRLLQEGTLRIACNLGTGSGYSVREVVDAVRRVTGHPIPEVITERRAGDPPELVSGGRLARELLGWEPRRSSLEAIVGDAWNFLQRKPDGFSE